jgi:bifunctional non-homologous end joining protein LigD
MTLEPYRAKSKSKASPEPRAQRRIAVAGIAISHPDKLLYPEAGLSKLDLAQYYASVSKWIVPHLRARPLSLFRCPDGWGAQCFFQKHADRSVHASVARMLVPEGRGTATYLSADSASAVVALLQWGVLELHPWGARQPKLDRPDRLIFDFDPDSDVPWKAIVEAVRLCRKLLEEIGLTGFLKTTGGKGLHIVVPIRPTLEWSTARGFTRAVADTLTRTFPDRFLATAAKSRRGGKIFVDYLRNTQGATAVAPYSLRARANAPVATPIEWEELSAEVRFDHFNAKNVPGRLAAMKRDPWAALSATRQTITRAMRRRVGDTAS